MNNSKFIKIKNSKIHYIDAGEGDPIVFLHGIPASSYLWRNVIPVFKNKAHCIAPDLIGMGQSDKPNIKYTFCEHVRYFEDFVKTLNLKNITLVMHGLLGSAIGFNYAMHNQDNIKAIAFYESYVRPITDFKMLSLPMQQLLHPIFKNPEIGYKAVVEDNFLIEKLIPLNSLNQLNAEVMDNYRQPFLTALDRIPLWQHIQEFFIDCNEQQLLNYVAEYSEYLKESSVPKLMLYTVPGFITTMDCVNWAQNKLSNLQTVDLEEGFYLAPESNPLLFGQILLDWYENISLLLS